MADYKLVDNSDQVLREFAQKKERALKTIGEVAISHAKTPISSGGDMPVDSGRLMNSVDYKVDGSDVYIGTNVEYAPNQEYIHHFLKNAAANHGDEYKNIMETSLKS